MISLIYIDLFCGGGGTTTGVHSARINGENCAIVACCVNHDEKAIKSHKSNHKQTLHFTEDITLLYNTSRMEKMVKHVESLRLKYPKAQVVLWASLECTNFSKAKGGQPRDADSRTLANHLFPYIEALNPDRIQIENVEEFMSWGELDNNGKPISRFAGLDYQRWIKAVSDYGYKFDYRILNAADFGALTSRKRFFGQFCRQNEEIFWPEQTHAAHPENNLFVNHLKKWRAVKEVLDFSDEGESMFDRRKPLVDATWERTYAGLIKFVAGGKKEFLLKYNSMSKNKTYVAPSVDNPCPTIATQGRLGLCNVQFIQKAYSGRPEGKVQSINKPAGTITTKDHHQVIFLQKYFSGNPENKVASIELPSPTLTTKDRLAFVAAYYGNGDNVSAIDSPSPTLTTKDRLSLVPSKFIDMQYGNGSPASVDAPAPTVTTNPKHKIVDLKWLMNPQFKSEGRSIDKPCFTLIARMDKRPPYLVDVTTTTSKMPSFIKHIDNVLIYEIYDTDSEIVKKVKEFMALYGIVGIKMRMLRIPELKMIMGFPKDYVLIGSQADQKKFIGNAVEVKVATAIVEATAKGCTNLQLAA